MAALHGAMPYPSSSQIGASAVRLQNPMSLPPLTGGRLFGAYGEKSLGGITVGQAILGGAAALLGGATILNQNKLPVPGNKPADAPTGKGSSEINVVPRTDQLGDGGALVKGDDSRNPCLDRWEREYNRCDKFSRPSSSRFKRACQARANARLSLCYDNGGTPHPEEPSEYFWKDIARDHLRR